MKKSQFVCIAPQKVFLAQALKPVEEVTSVATFVEAFVENRAHPIKAATKVATQATLTPDAGSGPLIPWLLVAFVRNWKSTRARE